MALSEVWRQRRKSRMSSISKFCSRRSTRQKLRGARKNPTNLNQIVTCLAFLPLEHNRKRICVKTTRSSTLLSSLLVEILASADFAVGSYTLATNTWRATRSPARSSTPNTDNYSEIILYLKNADLGQIASGQRADRQTAPDGGPKDRLASWQSAPWHGAASMSARWLRCCVPACHENRPRSNLCLLYQLSSCGWLNHASTFPFLSGSLEITHR